MWLCQACTAAILTGVLLLVDIEHEKVLEIYLRNRGEDTSAELQIADAAAGWGFPPLVSRAEVARLANRILLALGAGNPAGEGYGCWPAEVPIPAVRPQERPTDVPPEVQWRKLTVSAQFLCAECRKGEMRCNEESGAVECSECGRRHQLQVRIAALPR